MSEKKKKKESFLVKRGFFITLVVVVAVMLITLLMNLILPEEEETAWDAEILEEELFKASVNSGEEDWQEAMTVHAPTTPIPAEETEPPQSVKETESSHEEISTHLVLERPVAGEIQKDHAPEELVYSETMQDWRTHEGVDLAAEEGAEVKAAADGVVEEVQSDGMMGAMVTISHPDGLRTVYANLQPESLPATGNQIRMGEVIGKVGQTATWEINDGPHLHFEVWEDGVCKDPKPFFPDLAPAM